MCGARYCAERPRSGFPSRSDARFRCPELGEVGFGLISVDSREIDPRGCPRIEMGDLTRPAGPPDFGSRRPRARERRALHASPAPRLGAGDVGYRDRALGQAGGVAYPSRGSGCRVHGTDGASRVAAPSLFHACQRHYPGGNGPVFLSLAPRPVGGLPLRSGGSAPTTPISRPAQRSLHVPARVVARPPAHLAPP